MSVLKLALAQRVGASKQMLDKIVEDKQVGKSIATLAKPKKCTMRRSSSLIGPSQGKSM